MRSGSGPLLPYLLGPFVRICRRRGPELFVAFLSLITPLFVAVLSLLFRLFSRCYRAVNARCYSAEKHVITIG